jgi:hypothetical protein
VRKSRTDTLHLLKDGSEWTVSGERGKGADQPAMQFQLKAGRLKVTNSLSYQKSLRCDYQSCGCRKNSFIWISPRYKSVYFEVPKVASSSIRKLLKMSRPDISQGICQAYLEAYDLDRYRVDIHCDYRGDYEEALHSTKLLFSLERFVTRAKDRATLKPGYTSLFKTRCFELFYGTLEMVKELFPDYFTFTVVRNPLDRMVSNWSMFTQKKNRVQLLSDLTGRNVEGMDFAEFCNITRQYHNHHWEPQMAYIPQDTTGRPDVEFIARLENFASDWSSIAARLGEDATMSRENASIRGDYREYMTADTRKQLLIDFRKDFLNFYPRELEEL